MSPNGLDFLKTREGLELEAYLDTGGVWTIGYGSTGNVEPGQTITEHEAHERLLNDVATAEYAVDRYVKVPLTRNQRDALISFAFNVGQTAFRGSTLVRKLNQGNYDAVPSQIMRWVYDRRKVVVKGLVNRREAECALWRTPDETMEA